MLKWLKQYIEPPPSPELDKLYADAQTIREQHSIALDNYHQAVTQMMKRMAKAERVVGAYKDGDNERQL
jgi:hypothetical protein